MTILVDIGNSRLKWGIAKESVFQSSAALDYRKISIEEALRPVWVGLQPPKAMVIASVADAALKAAIFTLGDELWPEVVQVVPQVTASAFGVHNAYRQPEKLGIDRWLALLAAHHFYPGGCCIVDCGTAITVDVIEADGRHLGGLISPGLLLMKKSLIANTAGLAFTEGLHSEGLAANTADAIDNGVLLAAIGLIEAVLQRLKAPYPLLLCGGDADVLASELQQPCLIDADLVLKGLSLFSPPENSA